MGLQAVAATRHPWLGVWWSSSLLLAAPQGQVRVTTACAHRREPDTCAGAGRSESVAESKSPPQDHKRWHNVATDHRQGFG
jgi:hypothetical protein